MTQEPGPKNLVEKRSRTRAGDQRQDPLLAAPEAAAGGRRFRRPFPQVLRCRALGNEDGQSAYQSVNYNACQDRDLQSPARQQHKGGDQGAGHRADRVEHVEQAHARTDGRVTVYCIAGQKRQRRAHATSRYYYNDKGCRQVIQGLTGAGIGWGGQTAGPGGVEQAGPLQQPRHGESAQGDGCLEQAIGQHGAV